MARIINQYDLDISQIVKLLQSGEVVALPSETVYGLAADATNSYAVEKIYTVKQRPNNNPLIAHVSNIQMAEQYCIIDPVSRFFMEKFWPGALSLVLPVRKEAGFSSYAMAGLSTVAMRCPKGIFNTIIAEYGRPLVAPSANSSGKISPTSAQDVQNDIGKFIPIIVDGGRSDIGVESTIIKIVENKIYVLRPGGIPNDIILNTIEEYRRNSGSHIELILSAEGSKIEAPGMLNSHYAPNAKVNLGINKLETGWALLKFGEQNTANEHLAIKILNLSLTGDLNEAAHNLYRYLRILDLSGASVIGVENVPNIDLGIAINDRLKRAAAPR